MERECRALRLDLSPWGRAGMGAYCVPCPLLRHPSLSPPQHPSSPYSASIYTFFPPPCPAWRALPPFLIWLTPSGLLRRIARPEEICPDPQAGLELFLGAPAVPGPSFRKALTHLCGDRLSVSPTRQQILGAKTVFIPLCPPPPQCPSSGLAHWGKACPT